MSIMVEMPPVMMQEAAEYAMLQGTTLEQMVFNCVKKELARKHQANEIRNYLMNQNGWLPNDYTFSREEANAR